MAVGQTSILQGAGFLALVLYGYFLVSRVLDLTVPSLRIPLGLFAVLSITALLTGLARVARSRVNVIFLLYMGWMALGVVFSHWRGGSAELWQNSVKVFVFFLSIQALTTDYGKLRWMIRALAMGIFTAAVLGIGSEDDASGRLKLSVGTLSDPNEFAMYMVLGLCFWLCILKTSSSRFLAMVIGLPAVLLILGAFLKTGSRGGMVALVVVLTVWMMQISARGKMFLALAAILAIAIAPFAMTDYQKSRFLTVSSVDAEGAYDMETAQLLGGSVASTESRRALLVESLTRTIQNPLFGVGPGMFPLYSDYAAKQAGYKRGHWQPTHNLFTQISSECGIPALLLYLAGLFLTVSELRSLRSAPQMFPGAQVLRETAGYLLMALYGVLAAGMFLSIAYGTIVYVVLALSWSLIRIYREAAERSAMTRPVAAPVAAAPMGRRPALGLARQPATVRPGLYPTAAPRSGRG